MLRKQRILIAAARSVTKGHETVTEHGKPFEALASIYPQGDGITAQIYGLHPDEMRTLILPRNAEIKAMDAVWLPVDDPDSAAPWEVTGAPVYSRHITATLRRRVNFGG
jgi:hypothetical protein